MKKLGIGCLIVAVIMLALGIYGYTQREAIAKYMVAQTVSYVAKQKLESLNFPPEEQAAILESVEVITTRIRADDFDEQDVERLLRDPEIAPAFGAVLVDGFGYKYLATSDYDEAAKTEARKTMSRFQDAILRRQVPEAVYEQLAERLLANREDMLFEESITRDQLDACLRIMSEAADQAGVPDTVIEIDATAELKRAVDRATGDQPPAAPVEQEVQEQPADDDLAL